MEQQSGLSDYYNYTTKEDDNSRTFRQTTYSHIMTNERFIRTKTLVEYTPNPMCIEQLNCSSCLALSHPDGFHCAWCPDAKRCSDGYDPYTADWISKKCDVKNVTEHCFERSVILTTTTTTTTTKTTKTTRKQQTLTSVNTTPALINTESLVRNSTTDQKPMRTDTTTGITNAPDNSTVSQTTVKSSTENTAKSIDAAGTTEVETRATEKEPEITRQTAVNTLISTNSIPGMATNATQKVDGKEHALTNTVVLPNSATGSWDLTNLTTLKPTIQTLFSSDTRKTETDEFIKAATTAGGLETAETSDVVRTTVTFRNETTVPCTATRSSRCALSESRILVLCVLLPLLVGILTLLFCMLVLCTWKRRHRGVLRPQTPQHYQHTQVEQTVNDDDLVNESVPEKRAPCERRLTIYTCSSCGGVTRVAATGRTNPENSIFDEPLQSRPKGPNGE
ncbi:plexin domain-containing protein 1 [Clonorchis sinensis]|uniref:Plexin domain-containing protein 1 n=1 Tax=Clonorchis sinensis TaxID=79923 RepID=G7Y4G2_CLOSI|nr:plexin domain-containing protein 1 [Clonorchis sinensis]